MRALRFTPFVVALSTLSYAAPRTPEPPRPPAWLGEQMPLALTVSTPEDLGFKTAAERAYLVFNLMAAGKTAFDRGDWALAASKWEALLRVPSLPPDVEASVRPLAHLARARAGGDMSQPLPAAPPAPASAPASSGPEGTPEPRRFLSVTGTVSGGGTLGPGGTVVMLRRAEGVTPKPRPTRVRAVYQKDKRFHPRVLAVPLGSVVEFRNDDELFHNVFSLSKPNDFDLGLYKGGASKDQGFNSPGPVHLLCNIHASMQGYVYVVDTAYFAQADAAGKFTVKGVPPGDYLVEAWHEAATKLASGKVRVGDGMEPLSLTIDGDKKSPAFVPDKSGKARQPQLGY